MQQLEERARHARNSIELSTSVVTPSTFTPPPRRVGTALIVVVLLAVAGLVAAVGLTGGSDAEVASADGAINRAIPDAASAIDATEVDQGLPAAEDDDAPVTVEQADVDTEDADDGGQSDASAELPAVPPTDEDTTAAPGDDGIAHGTLVLSLDPAAPDVETLIVPDVVRNAARSDLYGRAGADDPFVDGDLEIQRTWNLAVNAPRLDGEEIMVAGRAVFYEDPGSPAAAAISWTETDGTTVRVRSYTLSRERLEAAAASVLSGGPVDAGGLDLLADDVRSLLAWSNLPPGATLYRAAGVHPSPGPTLVPGANIYQIAVELGAGASEDDERLQQRLLQLRSSDSTTAPPAPVTAVLQSPGGVTVNATAASASVSRLRFETEHGLVTITLLGSGLQAEPFPAGALSLVDTVDEAAFDQLLGMVQRGDDAYGTYYLGEQFVTND